jgi:hypothetical protein
MIKRLVHATLKALLDEAFVNVSKDALKFDIGGIFSGSSISFKNLDIRPDFFDVCLHPLKLTCGHLGSLTIEGLAEAYLGGIVTLKMDQLYLVFTVDTAAEAEKIQIMKKILIELRSQKLSEAVIKEIVKRIQGLPNEVDQDVNKKRDIFLRAMECKPLFLSFPTQCHLK